MTKLVLTSAAVLSFVASGFAQYRINSISSAPRPTFEDDFNTGSLSPNWIVSNWGAPGGGVFRPDHINMSQGCLRLEVTQTKNANGSISSVGGEIQLNRRFGYGTYVFKMRASSTSPTYNGVGETVNGQVSATFNYFPDANYNSITEIDAPEVEGQNPNQLSFTVWKNGVQSSTIPIGYSAPEAAYHEYKFQWFAGRVEYFVDGVLVARTTANIPTQAAYPMINHWGTNSTSWGGLATPGVVRYMYVKSFKFYSGVAV